MEFFGLLFWIGVLVFVWNFNE